MILYTHSKKHRFWHTFKPKALLSCTLMLSFAIAPIAVAGYNKLQEPSRPKGLKTITGTRYKPPQRPSRPAGPTGSTGTRTGSCGDATKGTLTALAPLGHVGQTISTRPTFAWYVPDGQSYPTEFRLYSTGSTGKYTLLELQRPLQSVKGINQYTLPNKEPDLVAGQKYLWHVALLCNRSDPSKDQVIRTEVEVMAMPASLRAALAKTRDRLQRANLYAESGFWYDALAEALKDIKTKPFSLELLTDLMNQETSDASKTAQKQGDRLQQIIELEHQ